jgi:hypothetical protein
LAVATSCSDTTFNISVLNAASNTNVISWLFGSVNFILPVYCPALGEYYGSSWISSCLSFIMVWYFLVCVNSLHQID